MNWVSIVPLKAEGERKTRLTGHLTAAERVALTYRMARHVVSVLHEAGLTPSLLSPAIRTR